jgi:hypothetical protein
VEIVLLESLVVAKEFLVLVESLLLEIELLFLALVESP